MKLLMQLLREAGADTDKAFTIVPLFGGYFKAVKRVEEYSPDRLALCIADGRLTVTGKALKIDKYSEQDLVLRGEIRGVSLE